MVDTGEGHLPSQYDPVHWTLFMAMLNDILNGKKLFDIKPNSHAKLLQDIFDSDII